MDFHTVVIGTGFSGLGMAIQLKRDGRDDFVVLEKAADVGGTWRDNTYPGCACDIQSHMYSFSFEQNPRWSRSFSPQPEIWAYLREVTDRYGLRKQIRFGVEVTGARWDADDGRWHITTDKGDYTARFLVSGIGGLHIPNIPKLPGVERFQGETFHSAEWNHDFDLTGKRVAVVGTGASAVQFVPRIAPEVGKLTLFQRTPPWIMPKPDYAIPGWTKTLFNRLPGAQRAYRNAIYWLLEARAIGFNSRPGLLKLASKIAKAHMEKAVKDPELRAKLTPDYVMGCKRVLIANDYYPALTRDNVEVNTDGIREVTEHGIIDENGVEHEVDAIIYGTGFHVTDAFDYLDISGADGLDLAKHWQDNGIQTHMGITVAGFPNLFFLLGPNTALGHNSVVFMIESQIRYVAQAMALVESRRAKALDTKESAQARFQSDIQRKLTGGVWTQGGCKSWYLDSRGVNRTIWPGFTWRYWLRARKLDPNEFDLVGNPYACVLMEFGVLGPVEARVDGTPRTFGAGRERYVLATLLLGAGRPTTSARLIDALWDDPPRSAKAQLHNIISRLRRATGRTDLIVTHSTGYELRLNGKDTLDAAEFRGLVAAGRHARAAGDPAAAAELLDRALGLWRGPALADLPDELAAAARTGLHEERLAAQEARLDAWLALGRHHDMLTELAALLAEHPYRENLYEARMLAFAGAGRRADALATYRDAYRTLSDGLGIEPGPALRGLEQRILRGEDVAPAPPRVVARQLPPPSANLTGRDELVADVRAALDGPGPVTAVLVGPGGVGKTAVALAAAGRAVFTGGQLYADLRGTQDTPADPHAVVGRFLHALGVRQAALPRDRDERVALYRSMLAGSRTLVVLDDAASEEQVRPLLPPDPTCAALVTSRHQLAALLGVHRWTVPVLSRAAAVELLGRIAGPERVAAEPSAAAELAVVCGQFPLAVSIVAARLAVRQDWTLAEFAARLARERDRLDELAVGDLDVRASIGSSYATLSAGAARLLRLLGLVTATDWPAWVPTALFGAPARRLLDELVEVHLVEPLGRDGAGQERFRLHDLVADFAREEAAEGDAVHRVLEGWLALAADADRQVPHGEAFAPPVGTGPPPVAVTRPYEWFDAERGSLSTAIADAVRAGRADLAGRLALHMSGYLELRCFYEDWLGALQTAIPPVRAAGHDALLVRLLGAMFAAHSLADRYTELPAVAEEELAVARRLGDRAAEVTALVHTGRAARDVGRFGQAAERLAAAVALAGESGQALVEALTASAVLHLKTGDPGQAVEQLDRARALDDDPGHTARGVLYRYLTGLALIDLDRLDEAKAVLAEGRAVCTAIEDDVGLVYLGWASANVDIGAGEWQPAAAKLAEALRGAEKLGATDAVAEVLRSLGDLAAAQDRPQAAVDALHRSLTIWRDLGAQVQTARTLARLEHATRDLGDDAAATACHREWRGLLAELELDERCLRLPRFLR